MNVKKYFADHGRKGFTFIEMMVVVVVLSVALPAIFTIALIIFRQQLKVFALQTVKREGDVALSVLQVNLKNSAVSVHTTYPATDANETCTATSAVPTTISPMIFRDDFNNSFYFPLNGGSLSSASSVLGTPVSLTDPSVAIQNFTMSCNRPSTATTPIVSISYDVVYNTASTRTEDTAKLHYATKIKLRNN
jgi:prepilin-type N-terminal cleavage/methylation domain-containing protein